MQELINKYINKSNKKSMMITGFINVLLSFIIIVFSLYDEFENLFTSNFYISIVTSFIFTIMAFFFVDLFYTCIVSIIIILFNKYFNLKYLYIINYLFISQILFLNSLILLISILNNSIQLSLFIFILNIPILYLYYKKLIQKAYVKKVAAIFICITLLILLLISIMLYLKSKGTLWL